jgi:hypothetical protein
MEVGGSWFLAHGVFVVVHPDLEDMALDADGGAEVLDGGFVVLLDAPAELLGEGAHVVLLVGGEFGAEALLDGGRAQPGETVQGAAGDDGGGGGGGGARVVVVRVLVAVCRGAHRREGRHVVGGERGGDQARTERGGLGQLARRGERAVAGNLALDLAPVEVAVARARRAHQRPVVVARHELAAPVDGVPANAGRVVLLALAVAHRALAGALHLHRPSSGSILRAHHRLAQNLARLIRRHLVVALRMLIALPVPARHLHLGHIMLMLLLLLLLLQQQRRRRGVHVHLANGRGPQRRHRRRCRHLLAHALIVHRRSTHTHHSGAPAQGF